MASNEKAMLHLQFQLNKNSQQVMEILNSLESENFFPQNMESQVLSSPPIKIEEILIDTRIEGPIMKENQNRKKKRFNKSLWTLQENLKYVRFLQQNKELFASTKENRRMLKINKMISLSIGTRSPDQCRSHHQKMIKYHQSIEGIINHVYLMHTLFVEDPLIKHAKQGKVPMRLRKKVSKVQPEEVTHQDDVQKDIWDVLSIPIQQEAPIEPNILYL